VPLRWLERWLHQHLFKVGWLATRNLRTTTILYYTFFLPGVALHQFFFWLIAGVFNVRAERALTWPAEQAIGELRLDFIRLAKGTDRVRIALISLAPLVAGLAAIWLICNHVLNVQPILDLAAAGKWDDLPAAVAKLTSTPDFYIWVYIVFTISNTMMPSFSDLKPLRIVAIALVGFVAASLLFHVADQPILTALSGPVANGLRVLAGTFAIMMAFDVLAVVVLGTIEALIERVTGDSATFQNGKMVTMRREELQRLREQEQARRDKERARRAATPSGPPSIYKVQFPIPDAPGREAEPITVRRDDAGLPAPSAPTPSARPSPTLGSPAPATFSPAPKPASPSSPSPVIADNEDLGEPAKPIGSPLRPAASRPSPSPFGGSAPDIKPDDSEPFAAPKPSSLAMPRPAAAPTSGAPSPLPRPTSPPSPGSPIPRPGGSTPSGLPPRPATSTGNAAPVRSFGGPPKPSQPNDEDDEGNDDALANAAPAQPRGTLRPGWMSKPATAPTPAPKPSSAATADENNEEADDAMKPTQPVGTVRAAPKPAQPLSGRSMTDFTGAGLYDNKDDTPKDDGSDDDDVSYEPAEEIP
jgi:hypothetical protein